MALSEAEAEKLIADVRRREQASKALISVFSDKQVKVYDSYMRHCMAGLLVLVLSLIVGGIACDAVFFPVTKGLPSVMADELNWAAVGLLIACVVGSFMGIGYIWDHHWTKAEEVVDKLKTETDAKLAEIWSVDLEVFSKSEESSV